MHVDEVEAGAGVLPKAPRRQPAGLGAAEGGEDRLVVADGGAWAGWLEGEGGVGNGVGENVASLPEQVQRSGRSGEPCAQGHGGLGHGPIVAVGAAPNGL